MLTRTKDKLGKALNRVRGVLREVVGQSGYNLVELGSDGCRQVIWAKTLLWQFGVWLGWVYDKGGVARGRWGWR